MPDEIDPELKAAVVAFVRAWVGEGKDRFADVLLNDEHSNFRSMFETFHATHGRYPTFQDGNGLRFTQRDPEA